MKHKVYVINTKESKARLRTIEKNLEEINLSFERVQAIEPVDLINFQNKYNLKKNKAEYHKILGAGEICCYLSHIKCWEMIVANNLDFAVILEDDVSVDESILNIIHLINKKKIDFDWDYLKLGESPEKRKYEIIFSKEKHEFIKYIKAPSGTFGQIVSNRGARKLILNSIQIYRPVDIDIQYVWENKLKIFGVRPYPVTINETTGTIDSIQNRKKNKTNYLVKLKNILKEKYYLLFN
jgi:glycosyl transferase, family 25